MSFIISLNKQNYLFYFGAMKELTLRPNLLFLICYIRIVLADPPGFAWEIELKKPLVWNNF